MESGPKFPHKFKKDMNPVWAAILHLVTFLNFMSIRRIHSLKIHPEIDVEKRAKVLRDWSRLVWANFKKRLLFTWKWHKNQFLWKVPSDRTGEFWKKSAPRNTQLVFWENTKGNLQGKTLRKFFVWFYLHHKWNIIKRGFVIFKKDHQSNDMITSEREGINSDFLWSRD